MNELLKRFLDRKKEEELERQENEKQQTLINLGLYNKVYSDMDFYNDLYPDYEQDSGKWYKKEVIDITDEEYQEVKKYSKKENVSEVNYIATALTVIAWVLFIVGFIAGIAFGTVEVEKGNYYTYTDTEFSFAVAFVYWCISLVSGIMFLGFAEIIKLLDDIKKK